MKKTVFLLLAILLSVTAFGINTEGDSTCTKEIPCKVLDRAQRDIEAGRICEQQYDLEKKAHKLTQGISQKKDMQITELVFENRNQQDDIDKKKQKIKRKNIVIFLETVVIIALIVL